MRAIYRASVLVWLGIICAPSSALGLDEEEESLTLRVSEQKSISARGVKSYSEGTPGIADIRVTRDQRRFVIVGKRVGTTSLLLINRDGSQQHYTIRVTPADAPTGLGARENIRLDLYFVLVQDKYSHRIGLNWPGNIGATAGDSTASFAIGGGSGQASTSTFQILGSTLLPSLDLAQSRGWAKLYRQAALITANGTEAVFNAGGEFNVQLQNNLTVGVKAIEFGTRVSVLPRYDSKTGRIELEITADVSDLDTELGGAIPGRLVTHLETLVNLELGQAVSLAGIRARSERRSKSGFPGLGTVPYFGALFGSHSRGREDLEAFMFMVPSVVEPVSLSQRNRIDEAMRVYEKFRGGVDDVHLLDQPRTRTIEPEKKKRK